MKIHFRLVDGEKAMFLELADSSLCGFGSQELLADLPGNPLEYADMNTTLLKVDRYNSKRQPCDRGNADQVS
ncbi:hypothetical protein JCM31598_15410 [Desulfonatronum parangueonense]